MSKKIKKNLLLMFLCVIVILGFRSSTVQAAMADEAEDFRLQKNHMWYYMRQWIKNHIIAVIWIFIIRQGRYC